MRRRRLVAGVDSSTQSCKVLVCDATTGAVVRSGRAGHPDGTEVDPEHWWQALLLALDRAGGLDGVDAVSVAAQQHGMVCLDAGGATVRPALLWNDTRSARTARDLVREHGGPAAWARDTGSVPLASFTVAKLRWLAEHEPDAAAATAAVCLPHDWLTWRLRERAGGLDGLTTDHGDASGTGYYSPAKGAWRDDLLALAMGRVPALPRLTGAADAAGHVRGVTVGAGTGDNMAAALGLGVEPGDVVVSLGTSGTVFAVCETPSADPTGTIAGFADATGRFLPLVCTLNAAGVLDATASMLGVDHDTLSELALDAPPGAGGVVLVPYLMGERTPDRPNAAGAIHGLTMTNATPRHLARAAVEGMLCGLADGLDALRSQGVAVERVSLVGGAARAEAVRRIAPSVLGLPVAVPRPAEYVALGAARQAAWALTGPGTAPPDYHPYPGTLQYDDEGMPGTHVRERYADARDHVLNRAAAH